MGAILLIAINVPVSAQQRTDWNGYLQYRFSENYLNQNDFSVRRSKLWVTGVMPLDTGKWSYKLQANFLQKAKYQLLLQDVRVSYKTGNFDVTAGQFVPDFSLQRKQPDYLIPLVERADVVNAIVPGAETMARDIGFELKMGINKSGAFSVGFYNGNGANTISNKRNFLYVTRGTFNILNNSESKLELGYNLSYRNAHDMSFNKIFGDNDSFTGRDIRFGLEGKLNVENLDLQSEFIQAQLGNKRAYGYYALADYLFNSKNLAVFSIERFKDLNPATADNPKYTLGYSYLMKGYKIKVSLDNQFQFTKQKTYSFTTVQIQYFFNQKQERQK